MASSREYLIAQTIYDKWNSTAELAISCPGGLRFIVIKQPSDQSEIPEPYCTFTVDITNVKKQAGTAVQAITAMVKFQVYGGVASEVSGALGDIQNTFTWGTVLNNPTGGTFLSMTSEPGSGIDAEMWMRAGRINRRGTHVAKVMVSL